MKHHQTQSNIHNKRFCDTTLLNLPKTRITIGQSTFQYSAAMDWNSLLIHIREHPSLSFVKSELYDFLFK